MPQDPTIEDFEAAWEDYPEILREAEEQEQGPPCSNGGIDPRDPNFDPEHDWYLYGEADGTDFYRCRKCGKESTN